MRKVSSSLAKYRNTPWKNMKPLHLFSSITSFRITKNLLGTKQMFLFNIIAWLFFKWLLSTDVSMYRYTFHLLILFFLCKQQIALLMPFWSKDSELFKNEAGSQVRLFFVYLVILLFPAEVMIVIIVSYGLDLALWFLPFSAQSSMNHSRGPGS